MNVEIWKCCSLTPNKCNKNEKQKLLFIIHCEYEIFFTSPYSDDKTAAVSIFFYPESKRKYDVFDVLLHTFDESNENDFLSFSFRNWSRIEGISNINLDIKSLFLPFEWLRLYTDKEAKVELNKRVFLMQILTHCLQQNFS